MRDRGDGKQNESTGQAASRRRSLRRFTEHIAVQGSETAPPLIEAGVALVQAHESRNFGSEHFRIVADPSFRAQLVNSNEEA